jgi:hypothetical protein
MKIQKLRELEAEMRAVARREATAPTDAALPSVESAEGLVRLLDGTIAEAVAFGHEATG